MKTLDFNYDFNANLFTRILDIPPEIAIEPSDAILVYRLEYKMLTEIVLKRGVLIPQNFFYRRELFNMFTITPI